jgi:hypothetical protein
MEGAAVAQENGRAVRLARRLRDLREHEWPDVNVTQAHLATALSTQTRVAPATLSSWESLSSPKTPTTPRLNAYALFFATRRSLEGGPHLLSVDDLDDGERERFEELRDELLALHGTVQESAPEEDVRRALLYFDDPGPVVIICPEAPSSLLGALADEDDVNHNRLHRYADLDALIEVFGHLRALNPQMHVLHRLPSDVQQVELQNHLVLIGGIGWNRTVRRILSELRKLPIEQIEDERLKTGEVFRVRAGEGREEQTYFPVTEEIDGQEELVEDLALVARLPNPFNSSRTLTICNGVHSKGVTGAVLTVTDETVRPANEQYLAQRFPEGAFAMLVRVPVVSGKVLAPDLQNPDTRVFEWSPESAPPGE